MTGNDVLLSVQDLTKNYVSKKSFFGKPLSYVHAVDDVSLDIYRGETLGVVGESGCGKSTLGRSILRLIEPTSGKIIYNGTDLRTLDKEQMRQMRRKLQLIFQDPYASLNPRMTVLDLIKAPLDVFNIGTQEERVERVLEMMSLVGLTEEQMNRYPHEFSGGQRQRIVIARAIILGPEFVVCDEPVSALDVSVRAQVLNLLCSSAMIFRSSNTSVTESLLCILAVLLSSRPRMSSMILRFILTRRLFSLLFLFLRWEESAREFSSKGMCQVLSIRHQAVISIQDVLMRRIYAAKRSLS